MSHALIVILSHVLGIGIPLLIAFIIAIWPESKKENK